MKPIKNVSALIDSMFFCLTVLFLTGCSQVQQNHAAINEPDNKMTDPQVTILSSLPDSMKPPIIVINKLKKFNSTINIKQPPPYLSTASNTHGSADVDSRGVGFFTNFTTDQGLPQDISNSIIVDKNGNVWFGTGAGVSRYDGKKFTTFTTVEGLASNYVTAITEDEMGNLWFGTGGGGISRYDGKKIINYTTAQGLPDNFINSIIQDKTGKLWVGTNRGVSRFDGKNFVNYTSRLGIGHNIVQSIKEDKTGAIWFATAGGGVTRYDDKDFINYTSKQGLASNIVKSIAEDESGNLWFGTTEGISCYNGKNFINYTTGNGLPDNFVRCMMEDKSGNLWLGTGHGLSRYDGKGFTNYTSRQGIANDIIYSMAEDKSGNLWFGTFGGGVSRFDGNSIMNYTISQGLAGNAGFGITVDKEGKIWLGTDHGVSRYDGKNFVNYSTRDGLASNRVYNILEDKAGNLWFGTENGITSFNGKRFTNYTSSQGLVSGTIVKITQDKSGNLWFGSYGGGMSCYDGRKFTNYTTLQGLANNIIRTITEDKKGNLWVGTGAGISLYDGKSFTNYTTKQGLANNFILNITQDKFGNLWIGSDGGGITRYDGKSFISFNTSDGLPDNAVTSVVSDSAGNIFMGTNYGIGVLIGFKLKFPGNKTGNRLPAQNNLSNEELKKYIPEIEIYNSSTGYPIKDVNWGQNAMFIDSNKIVWICTGSDKTGLVRFDYSAVHRSTNSPVVVLQGIKVNNENVCWYDLRPGLAKKGFQSDNAIAPNIIEEVSTLGKVLSEIDRDSMRIKFDGVQFDSLTPFYPIPQDLALSYKHNNVTFDFGAIEPDRPYLVKYQYTLEGYDKGWNPPTDKTSATYGNIFEGTYLFKLKARSPFGIWSEPITYKFKVLPPWWRTWWTYSLYILVFFAVVWNFIKWRISRLKKEKTLLEEKVAIRTHELKEKNEKLEITLSELKSAQSQLIQSEKMASLGELTAGIAHEIQNPLNFVNNFSEVNKEMLEELKAERLKPNAQRDDDLQNDLIDDVIANEEKINHHGKRADAIVKGMLQHSRSGTGVKEPTDINAIAGEYLRLSYHGLKAKDKDFNVELKTDFDNSIGKINIIPQEIGRVLLNLYNNAFYAVSERRKAEGSGYEPTVAVVTKKSGNKVLISVSDNGNGIPKNIIDKIFQPFFTTKPTGQGTGLGLSLSYDIIKAHGGEIKVETKENEGATFIIQLPTA